MSDGSTSSLGFLQFMEAAPDAMVCVDESGSIVLVNKQAETMFGCERTEMLGNKIEVLIPERYRTAHVGHRDGYIASPHVRPMGAGMELKALRSDGSEFPVEISLSLITTPEGRIIAASIRDVSDRLRAEAKFRSLLDSTPDAMIIVNDQGDMVLVNRQAEAVFGYKRDELLNQKVELLIPERFRSAHPGHRDGFFANPRPRAMGSALELFALRKDGAEFPVEISLSPIETEEGRLVAAAVRDVTERKQAEQQVREAQRKEQQLHQLEQIDEFRTRFINAAAHELFTPLTPIAATLNVLRKKGDDAVKRDKALDILGRSFGRLSDLVSDLLEASRFQSGKLSVRLDSADLVPVVSGVVDTFRASADERSIDLSVTLPSEMICTFDEKRINQVLYNLTSNALKFTPDGGKIHVSMDEVDHHCVIRIKDTGLGLNPDQLTRIFEPFVRVHEDSAPGTGLGLYISQGIIEAHGGTLTAESDGKGKGTTFIIRSPFKGVTE